MRRRIGAGVVSLVLIAAAGAVAGHEDPDCVDPANDEFEDATTVPLVPFVHTENNVCADSQPGEPANGCGEDVNPLQTIWYRYAPTIPSTVTARVGGLSNYCRANPTFCVGPGGVNDLSFARTVINVWRGTTLGGLEPLGCAASADPFQISEATVETIPGETYYFQIHHLDYGGFEYGQLVFSLVPAGGGRVPAARP